jgi:hypothetical protein
MLIVTSMIVGTRLLDLSWTNEQHMIQIRSGSQIYDRVRSRD